MQRRFLLIVLDGCGVGALPGEPAADTLGNTARAVGGLRMPHLERWGLGNVLALEGVAPRPDACAWWGRLREASCGKDTVTGHWEMMGVVTDPPLPLFPDGFPRAMIDIFERAAQIRTLGGRPASGTEILTRLGTTHLETGFPIVYTSADSVFQIAAHEERFGLERLYELCRLARALFPVGRVIARPFVGDSPATFRRTENRRDWPLPPPEPTALDSLAQAGRRVHLIGRTCELFPDAPGQSRESTGANPAHGAAVERAARGEGPGGDADFVFANFEDFDMLCGHRNDPAGFARLLEAFDTWFGERLVPSLRPGDRVGLTADHGNDPTTLSTDHDREFAPLLLLGAGIDGPCDRGERDSFCDWGASVCRWLDAPAPARGVAL